MNKKNSVFAPNTIIRKSFETKKRIVSLAALGVTMVLIGVSNRINQGFLYLVIDLTDLTALNLTHVQILSHYSKFITRINAFEEKYASYEEEHGCKVIRISDGDGVIVNIGCIFVIRADKT